MMRSLAIVALLGSTALAQDPASEQKACDGGENAACWKLGWRNAHGTGVPVDEKAAMRLFQKACYGGVAQSCTQVGWMYKSGRGTMKSDALALALFQRACNAGDQEGCAKLAIMQSIMQGGSAPANEPEPSPPPEFAPPKPPPPPPPAPKPASSEPQAMQVDVQVGGKYGKGKNLKLCKETLGEGGVQITDGAPMKLVVTLDKPNRLRISNGERVFLDEVRAARSAEALCTDAIEQLRNAFAAPAPVAAAPPPPPPPPPPPAPVAAPLPPSPSAPAAKPQLLLDLGTIAPDDPRRLHCVRAFMEAKLPLVGDANAPVRVEIALDKPYRLKVISKRRGVIADERPSLKTPEAVCYEAVPAVQSALSGE
jgi:hypothetical protein